MELKRPRVLVAASGMDRTPVLARANVFAVAESESVTAVAVLAELPTKILADESVDDSLELNTLCKSVWEDSVPVIEPHVAAPVDCTAAHTALPLESVVRTKFVVVEVPSLKPVT